MFTISGTYRVRQLQNHQRHLCYAESWTFFIAFYHQSDSYFKILSNFYSEHDEGSRPPSNNALVECLMELLDLPGLAPVYLIVDALDEYPNASVVQSPRSPRAKVLSFIKKTCQNTDSKSTHMRHQLT